MRKIQLIFCVLVLSVTALAGDKAELPFVGFIGFSEDGKYLAFEDSDYEGEGVEYEREVTYIIETAKNSFAAAPSVYAWDSDKPQKLKATLRARYKKDVAVKMKKFRIVRGNTGFLVVSHLLYDWSYTKPVESLEKFTQSDGTEIEKMKTDYEGGYVPPEGGVNEKIIFNPEPGDFAFSTSKFYELTLNVNQIKSGKDAGSYKIELTLKDNTQNKEIPLRILQKDADELPESRQAAFAYKVEKVYLYSNKIAVFINVFSYGFEVVHIGNMVVTGEIE